MNFTETLRLAMSSISAHKLRSFLTLLGMIIGMTAFMIVLSLLLGFNGYVDEKIAGIGSNAFTVQRFNFSDFRSSLRKKSHMYNEDEVDKSLKVINEELKDGFNLNKNTPPS